ncbi:hypothetical protein DCAR_0417045 [Daucus carota subsp. sativus]|uniref:Uncharacterized protein n=1 Tax=Daucus carota subsp. sativus TaxID=79200 RepID=A0AAF0WY19_DAUCS|nr:PREDICTED: uncharacterized protein At5g43822 isoform X1 [Daucus carota subsp. sativus]WOG97704.1 hypothetical protein DCAR_0417045 [Daucus carota subsp. sativus]
MEAMVKKYQQKFKKVKEYIDKWEELQSLLLSQFRSASAIINRLQLIQNSKKYGALKSVDGIGDAIFTKQMNSLQNILLSMNKTLEEFHAVVISLEKIVRDGRQLVKGGGSIQPKVAQLQQRIGIKPSLADCLEGLVQLHDMHRSEYLLKSSVVSALPTITLEPSESDLEALQQLLVDQPNIPKDEVQFIYDIIYAEDIC